MRKIHVIWLSLAVVSLIANLSPSIAGESQGSAPLKFITIEKDLLPYCQELRYANRYCRRKQKQWECFDHAVANSPKPVFTVDFRPTCTKWDIESVQKFCEVWTDAGPVWYYDVKNTVYGKSSAVDAILKSWKRDGPVTLEYSYSSEPMFLCLLEKAK